jgi:hypothetical protein
MYTNVLAHQSKIFARRCPNITVFKSSLNYECCNVIHTVLTSRLYFDSICFILFVSLLSREGLLYESHQITNCQTLSVATDIGAGYPGGGR